MDRWIVEGRKGLWDEDGDFVIDLYALHIYEWIEEHLQEKLIMKRVCIHKLSTSNPSIILFSPWRLWFDFTSRLRSVPTLRCSFFLF